MTKIDINIIERNITGTASAEEQEILCAWLESDKVNRDAYFYMKNLWDSAAAKNHTYNDIHKEWLLLFNKIKEKETANSENSASMQKPPHTQQTQQTQAFIRKFPLKSFLRYAAVFVIAFGLSWAIQKITADSAGTSGAFASPQFTEILVPYGSKAKVKLPDSSSVWLNAGARMKYRANFENNIREVHLQGEGFFDVVKDSLRPFIVSGNGIDIKVIGTKFNLMANADDNLIEATLVEGAIEVLGMTDPNTQSNVILKPGQKLTLYKENDKYAVHSIQEAGLLIAEEMKSPVKIRNAKLVEKTNVEITTAWTENKLVFVKERFEDVKTKLERWYGVEIEVKDKEILDYRFTGTFEKQTFEQAMNALSKAASCRFKIDKNKVVITK